ncbi:hypothetical protein, variant 1 [Verruconis gallopava]|uniref:GAF domain-containing protein n=1 Tax=Verruconis gallopava TaxID=253628 RepID=A0A0D2AWL7_9PEZI|nr:hypothetical protein, variant 1 [Verruconis gallopava]KIW03524.1 hypothetical protein, variant 1 [Verruconis gallopava]
MVHADSSTFASGLSKAEVYTQVLEQAQGLFESQRNWVCNLANASSLLYHGLLSLPRPSSAVNWCKVACQTIAFGRGVCGTAAKEVKTQLVPNVDAFPGHIACDSASKSEIVVPIIQNGKTVAIIDIDCAELEGFDEEDKEYLEKFSELISKSSDF